MTYYISEFQKTQKSLFNNLIKEIPNTFKNLSPEDKLLKYKTYISSSEMYRLCNETNYNFLKQKFQQTKEQRRGNPITRWWGLCMEEITIRHLESKIFKNKIYRINAYKRQSILLCAQPDGLYLDKFDRPKILEIKSPFSRKVLNIQPRIKDLYQIQATIMCLGIMKANLIYSDFKRCSKLQLNQIGQYNYKFHRQHKIIKYNKCIFQALIIWDVDETQKEIDDVFLKQHYNYRTDIYISYFVNILEKLKEYNRCRYVFVKCFNISQNYIQTDFKLQQTFKTNLYKIKELFIQTKQTYTRNLSNNKEGRFDRNKLW